MNNKQIIAELRKQASEFEDKAQRLYQAADILSELESSNEHGNAKSSSYSNSLNTDEYSHPIMSISETAENEVATDAAGQIASIIRSAGRFLHKNEIENLIGEEDRERFKYLSSILSAAASKGKHDIVNIREGRSKNTTFWGFKDWLDSTKNVKPKYHYKEDVVQQKKAKARA
ncbi:hypothetical protein [Chitinophaga vietnamensis]|uniref:hypothetical protein n=1 Tax=Chitinophaga vietnamensis TaxID=2593957 RepID=UPI001178517A|nr:hypothetical protein [Chitinophaga vietnamensis]